jgi:ribosomal protein L44E
VGKPKLGPPIKKEDVECKCPSCGNNHFVKMEWAGRGMPWKYCPTCKKSISSIDPLSFMVNKEAMRKSMRPAP